MEEPAPLKAEGQAVRIVCLSDTHALHRGLRVPDGDVLVHAGDLTRHGSLDDVRSFDRFLGRLPHRHKVVIAGNHDFCFEQEPQRARELLTSCTYLQDSGTLVEGLRFWGSPWQPWFYDWAFNLQRGEELRAVWARIPEEVDVLVTHGPPMGILDRTVRGEDVGCEDLLARLAVVRPRLHVFGHIHEAYGREERDGTIYVNASICTLSYVPSNPPVVVDL